MSGPVSNADVNLDASSPSFTAKKESGSSLVDRLDSAIADGLGETPAVETPAVETPEAETPAVETPEAETPEAEKPAEFTMESLSDPDAAPPEVEASEDEEDLDPTPPDEVVEQGPKATAKWKELKQSERQLKATLRENADLKAQLDEAVASPADSPDVQALQERVKAQEEALAVYHVEASQKYADEVINPLNALEARAKELAVDPVHENALISALNVVEPKERARALSEAAEQLTDYERTKLYAVAGEVDDVIAHRDRIRQNSQLALKEIQQAELAVAGQETTERRNARVGAADKVWDHLQKEIGVLTDDDGVLLPAFQEVRDQGRQLNLADPSTKVSTQTYSAFAGHLLPKLLTHYQQLLSSKDATISELEGSIAAQNGASAAGGRPTAKTRASSSTSKKSFAEAIDDAVNSGGVSFPRAGG